MLLGSIVSSTDAVAVFSVLRSKNVSLKGDAKPLLELESGSNDPMGVFLTLGLIELAMHPGESVLALVPMFVLATVVHPGDSMLVLADKNDLPAVRKIVDPSASDAKA